MLRPTLLACLVLLSSSRAFAAGDTLRTPPSGFAFLPGPLFYTPLAANPQEPRVGVRKELGSSRLKLDIGSSIDLLGYAGESGSRIRLGVDFFTYALTTSADGLRLQVDAVDGYFGGHVSWGETPDGRGVRARLRILHVSGHLIDGHWDRSTKQWRDNKEPIPYTRDFGELLGSYGWRGALFAADVYTGLAYATLVRPDDLARWSSLHGALLRTTGLIGPVLGRECVLYLADHVAIAGIPTYYATNTLECGIKFGSWEDTGIRISLAFTSGLEPFSQYYDVRRDQWGIALAFDFW
jgi:hypothetical protein